LSCMSQRQRAPCLSSDSLFIEAKASKNGPTRTRIRMHVRDL